MDGPLTQDLVSCIEYDAPKGDAHIVELPATPRCDIVVLVVDWSRFRVGGLKAWASYSTGLESKQVTQPVSRSHKIWYLFTYI
jgi:hypothetical protein